MWDVCNELDRYVSETRKTPGQKKSLWQGVSGGRGGVSLGYRKASRGAGAWIVKIALDGVRCEERLGAANDDDATPGGLSYPSAVTVALTWGRQQCEIIDAGKEAGAVARIPTVRSSVRQYIDFRQRRSPVAGANAKSRLTRHVLSDQKFADTKLSRLRTFDFDGWRERLPETLTQATVNRLLNDLRAALNLAVEKHRRELPAATALEIKIWHEGRRSFGKRAKTAPHRRAGQRCGRCGFRGGSGRRLWLRRADSRGHGRKIFSDCRSQGG